MSKPNSRGTKPQSDKDVLVLERCCKALDKSTSPRMLKANLSFVVDKYSRINFERRPS